MTVPKSRMKYLLPYVFKPYKKHPRLRDVPKVFHLREHEKPQLAAYLGRVVRTEYPRTCVVQVENTEIHPATKKPYQHQHWVHVHDPGEECYIGDEVVIGPRKPGDGVEYHGKPYQVVSYVSKAIGFTDHYNGVVWTRDEKPSSYRLEETRARPAYMEGVLSKHNLVTVKGKKHVLEEQAYGVRATTLES